ncbi:MAG: signal peptidase [Caulobacter sp.]|nr:signal peptidase [Caulobacter sp.]
MTEAADAPTFDEPASLDEGPDQPTAANEFVEIVKTVAYALLIALFLRILFFQPFTIPSESMAPNLLKGDYIIVTKFAYGWSRHSIPFSPPLFKGRIMGSTPKRGDIIVFKLPRDGHTDYIKRLVGLPGDRIQVTGGQVFVNGKAWDRKAFPNDVEDTGNPYRKELKPVFRFEETNADGRKYMTNDYGPDGDLDNTQTYLVPEGNYFFMGDNRDNSLDSRVPEDQGVGFVPAENLVGRADLILLSWDARAALFKPWTWFTHSRPSRFFHGLK